jgi:phage repressor protein C with HTH and peptisase S24 domain
MDTIWFHQALERVGASQADLARHLGLAASGVSRMLKGERKMTQLETVQTAEFLRVSPEEVLQHAVEGPAPLPPADAPRQSRGRPPSISSATGDRIPIRSAGRGGTDQEMFADLGYTSRPANLAGVREAYAIYMVGDSMEPRYEQGWLLHVNPFKPPRRGQDVVVRRQGAIVGDAVLVKQFVGWEGDTLVLRQFNPSDTLRISRGEVRECHLIVGAAYEG